MFSIIRTLFWVFIISQIVLISARRVIHVPVTQQGLRNSFIIKFFLLIAYAVYINIQLYPIESVDGFMTFLAPLSLRCFGYFFVFMLCAAVSFAYLPYTLKKGKIYQMSILSITEVDDKTYKICGKFREDKHDFDAMVKISDEDYKRLSAAGYFGIASTKKTLAVVYKRIADPDEYMISVEMTLADL